MTQATKTVKLENPFVPKSYDLEVKVDLSTWTYEVRETVKLMRCEQFAKSDKIELHAAPSIEIVSITGAELLTRDDVAHTLHLKLDDIENTSEPEIHFCFKHGIQEELRGFYRVRFQHEGKEHRMASTHFEPVSARRFYICHDEPAQRADFTLRVILPKSEAHYTVLSNGPLKSKEAHGDEVIYSFETIPKCPPYLTACVVGELEHIETTVSGIPLRVYTTPGKSVRAQFALKTAAFALKFFEDFFRCKFPLPKLDVVAVPDYPIGGMENWGCITCIESVLVDESKSSISALKRASELICHEVSHNWFGNLVAINWWESLWLKEGFASWCGNYASHVREPTWNCLQDGARGVAAAMETDMYVNSHPVEVPIRDPADITQIFDSISYDKGMGLVFMLEAFLGEDKWGPAAAHYINKYQYKDTKTVMLWEALEEATGQPVAEAMNSFTTQMGYPIVHVERTAPNKVTLRQEPCRFASSDVACDQTWCIPMVLEGLHGTEKDRVTVMLRGSDAMEVELPASFANSPFITANPRRTGFYRCRYDAATFQSWIAHYTELSAPDRQALISDTVASIQMGCDDLERLAQVADAVRTHEQDWDVLSQLNASIGSLTGALENRDDAKTVNSEQLSFLLPLAESQIAREPASAAEHLTKAFLVNTGLRLVIGAMAPEDARQSKLYAWAMEQVSGYLNNGTYYPATLDQCMTAYMRLDESTPVATKNEQLYQRFCAEDGNDEMCRALLYAICMSPDVAFVKDIMRRCMENNGVRGQFGGNVFMAVSSNPSFKTNEIWDFFKANFDGVDKQWGGGQFRIQVIVSFVGKTLSGEASAAEFETFFKTHPLPNAGLAIGRAAENMRLRAWLNGKWKSTIVNVMKRK